ncbi:MAG: inorganic diphosphatase [Candidatus Sericytochromatia bacterium]|nr:inorganic diphosphatase [Candidatus Sericytochromatia bacterium]
MLHHYHLPLGPLAPDEVHVVVEIPKGSRNKYEYNAALGVFELDRVLSSSMVYAADYGFMPQTLAGDGDPADALVLMEEPTFTGCLLLARPIGMMKMEDAGEDFKILAVPVHDKRYAGARDLSDVSPHKLAEIEHFFKTYKMLDHSLPAVDGWFDAAHAKAYITRCHAAYRETSGAQS